MSDIKEVFEVIFPVQNNPRSPIKYTQGCSKESMDAIDQMAIEYINLAAKKLSDEIGDEIDREIIQHYHNL